MGKISDWIIDEVRAYAKKQGPKIYRAFKKSGNALPSHIEEEFQYSLTAAFSAQNYQADGYAEWPDGSSVQRFEFLLPASIVTRIQKNARWAAAAKKSADGNAQIAAFGSDDAYEKALNAAMSRVVEAVVMKTVGEYHPSDQSDNYGWRSLTPVLTVKAAKKGTANFVDTRLFYWVYGKKQETAARYKIAKSLLKRGIIFKSWVAPSAGPFLS
jgi:hypothetical protein